MFTPVIADLPIAVAAAATAGIAVGAVVAWRWSRPTAPAPPGAAPDGGLARQLRRTELLARHANDVLVLVDDQDRLVDFNERLCELLGYTREEALQLTIRDLRDPATLTDLPIRTTEHLADGAGLFETRYRRKDGSTFPVEVSVRVAEVDGASYRQAVVRDITERRRMELQLHLADRMSSVATLAAGVAHEVNNPLAYVLANLDFVLSRLDRLPEEAEEVRKALEDARSGAGRVGQIVKDLRTFSRAGEAERSEVDVRRALQTAVTLAQTEIRQRAQLSLELGPVPPVLGNAHRLSQLFLNLLVNAAQAIPAGHPERHLVQASTALAPDGRIRIEITDTGSGIPAGVLPRIFDPFFTTRAVGKGLGLGLAIVHGIVADLGGEVTVRSEPGGGSIFTVLLPPARPATSARRPPALTPAPAGAVTAAHVAAPPRAPGPAAPPAAAPVDQPTAAATSPVLDLLVVDDEPMVGRAITRMLTPPHRVVSVHGAAEALARLAAGPFDAVLCDLMMPEMTGMELHARLLAEAPATAARMVFLTGGAFTREAVEFLERVPNRRLEKPFTVAELRAALAWARPAAEG
jgi:PAS domain S-box-containing protein